MFKHIRPFSLHSFHQLVYIIHTIYIIYSCIMLYSTFIILDSMLINIYIILWSIHIHTIHTLYISCIIPDHPNVPGSPGPRDSRWRWWNWWRTRRRPWLRGWPKPQRAWPPDAPTDPLRWTGGELLVGWLELMRIFWEMFDRSYLILYICTKVRGEIMAMITL